MRCLTLLFSAFCFQLSAFVYPLRVPIQVAFEAINDVARLFQAVKLAGIDDQLGGNCEATQRLIHLLGVK